MRAKTMDRETGLLLHLLDEAFDRKAWHGPNLFGSVRRLSPEEAGRRPAPDGTASRRWRSTAPTGSTRSGGSSPVRAAARFR